MHRFINNRAHKHDLDERFWQNPVVFPSYQLSPRDIA